MVTYNGWVEISVDVDGESDEPVEPKLQQINTFIEERAINENNVSLNCRD